MPKFPLPTSSFHQQCISPFKFASLSLFLFFFCKRYLHISLVFKDVLQKLAQLIIVFFNSRSEFKQACSILTSLKYNNFTILSDLVSTARNFSINLSSLSLHPLPFNSISLSSVEMVELSVAVTASQSDSLLGRKEATSRASAMSWPAVGH